MTAEDWIAFSQLINSNTFTQYKGKHWTISEKR